MTAPNLKFGDDYQTLFDPETYLGSYYADVSNPDEPGLHQFFHESLVELSAKIPQKFRGEILEIGSGPSIHVATIVSGVFEHILLSEFCQSNIAVLKKWLKGIATHDWKTVMDFIAKKEGSGLGIEEIQDRARSKIRAVYHCDVRNDIIVPEAGAKSFDAIVSVLCLESAVLDLAEYQKSLRKLRDLLKPEGYLLLAGVLEGSYYRVGEYNFETLAISAKDMQSNVKSAGFEILEERFTGKPGEETTKSSNYTNAFALLARKI